MGEEGKRRRVLFFLKLEKCWDFKNEYFCSYLWVKFRIQNAVFRVSRKKTPKFLRRVFLSCVLETHLDFAHYAVRK